MSKAISKSTSTKSEKDWLENISIASKIAICQFIEEMVPLEEYDCEGLTTLLKNKNIPPDIQASFLQVLYFRTELESESDRGAALLASSHLENMLVQLLRKKLIGTKKEQKSIFDYSGPLGTFSSLNMMCRALGLLTMETCNNIDIVRNIRNKFGHSPFNISFESSQVSSLMSNFRNEENAKLSNRVRFQNIVLDISRKVEAATIFNHKYASCIESEFHPRRKNFINLFKDNRFSVPSKLAPMSK